MDLKSLQEANRKINGIVKMDIINKDEANQSLVMLTTSLSNLAQCYGHHDKSDGFYDSNRFQFSSDFLDITLSDESDFLIDITNFDSITKEKAKHLTVLDFSVDCLDSLLKLLNLLDFKARELLLEENDELNDTFLKIMGLLNDIHKKTVLIAGSSCDIDLLTNLIFTYFNLLGISKDELTKEYYNQYITVEECF